MARSRFAFPLGRLGADAVLEHEVTERPDLRLEPARTEVDDVDPPFAEDVRLEHAHTSFPASAGSAPTSIEGSGAIANPASAASRQKAWSLAKMLARIRTETFFFALPRPRASTSKATWLRRLRG